MGRGETSWHGTRPLHRVRALRATTGNTAGRNDADCKSVPPVIIYCGRDPESAGTGASPVESLRTESVALQEKLIRGSESVRATVCKSWMRLLSNPAVAQCRS